MSDYADGCSIPARVRRFFMLDDAVCIYCGRTHCRALTVLLVWHTFTHARQHGVWHTAKHD
jgi:hypothetical protein